MKAMHEANNARIQAITESQISFTSVYDTSLAMFRGHIEYRALMLAYVELVDRHPGGPEDHVSLVSVEGRDDDIEDLLSGLGAEDLGRGALDRPRRPRRPARSRRPVLRRSLDRPLMNFLALPFDLLAWCLRRSGLITLYASRNEGTSPHVDSTREA